MNFIFLSYQLDINIKLLLCSVKIILDFKVFTVNKTKILKNIL